MKLAVHMNESNVKQVKNFLTCCSKLGTVLLIEASTNKMCWRIINSAKSACLMISLQDRFFEHYILYEVNLMTASVLLKHLLSAFRTPKIRSLELEIVDHEVLTIVVHSESGLMKRYQVACVEEEHLAASIDRNQLPTTIAADAFQLHKVLSSFQNSLDEISLVVRPQTGNPQTQGNQHIRMASYNGSGKVRKGKTLNTVINIDVKGGQLFKNSTLRSNDTMEATFNMKDFVVIVSLCKAMYADAVLHMGTPGTPLLVEAHNMGLGHGMDAVEAELLLATIAEYVQDDLPEVPPEAAATPAPHGGGRSNNPYSAGGFPTPGPTNPQMSPQHVQSAVISPPQFQHTYKAPHHQAPQTQHGGMHTQQFAEPSQQHAAPGNTQTPAHIHGHMQHTQAAFSGLVGDTRVPRGLQHQSGLPAIPETALHTNPPELRGMHQHACLATPPNFNVVGHHAVGSGGTDVTPSQLQPPALQQQHQPEAVNPAACEEPSQATHAQQIAPSLNAFNPSLMPQPQHWMGASDSRHVGGMHEEAHADPSADFLQHDAHSVGTQGAHNAPKPMSSWSTLDVHSPAACLPSAVNGAQSPGAGPNPSQQVVTGLCMTGTVDQSAGTAPLPGCGSGAAASSGAGGQGGAWVGGDGAENSGPQHNSTIAAHTQHGAASRSLVRLAEIIKQDERARQAGGSVPRWGASAAQQVETVSMRLPGDNLSQDDEQALEDAGGEFAADDWECLATPPEQRPDTFFD